jgi:ABC-type polysaccharide/polyol phosphate export permease
VLLSEIRVIQTRVTTLALQLAASSEMNEVRTLPVRERRSTVVLSPARSQTAQALEDFGNGFARWELWGTLGWHDIRQRYRRSTLGPFWLTISMGVMIGGLGVLYGGLFRQPIDDYLPYVALGLIVWSLISNLLIDGCYTFILPGEVIKQQPVPSSVHVFRMLWRNLIVFLHNVLIYVLVMITIGPIPGWVGLLSFFGLTLVCLNGVSIGVLLGLLSLRFRDFPPIIISLTQLIFFMTPILWKPDQLSPQSALIVDLNPFYYLIEIVRGPLLGHPPLFSMWAIAIALTASGYLVAFGFFVTFRRRIPYWL